MRLRIVTLAERPRALAALQRIQRAVWPAGMAYINQDAVCDRLWLIYRAEWPLPARAQKVVTHIRQVCLRP